jgi:hypothetical protein
MLTRAPTNLEPLTRQTIGSLNHVLLTPLPRGDRHIGQVTLKAVAL